MMNGTIKKVEGLKKTYNQRRLLEAVKAYNNQLKQDDIENDLYYEAVSELLDNLESGKTTMKSILDEAVFLMSDYEKLLKHINDDYKAPEQKVFARSLIGSPVLLLQVIFIAKHPKYKTLEGFIGQGHNKAFQRAVEDAD